MTITIGGNDVGFAYLLLYCFAHDSCHTVRPFEPHSNLELTELFPLLVALTEFELLDLFDAIKARAPNAATLVMDYPLVVAGRECAAATVPGFNNIKLSTEEQAWMRDANGC